jgi:hypothetical protein
MKTLGDPDSPTADIDVLDVAVSRLGEAVALLDAIQHGDLLAELPAGAEAALRHQCGVSLLAVLRRELDGLASELQSASYVQGLVGRISRPGRHA